MPRSKANCKFPDAKVQLTGHDGNAFLVMGRTKQALKRAGATPEQLKEFMDEASGGDYNHLLATCMKWANVS